MTFDGRYDKLKNSHIELRDQICKMLKIAEETFYYKRKNTSWTPAEKIVIAQLMNDSVEILFPESKKVVA